MHTLDKQGLGPGAGKCVSDSRGGGAARTTVAVQQVLSWVVLPWAVLTRVVPSWAGAPLDDAPQRVLTGVVLSWAGADQGGAHLGQCSPGQCSPGWCSPGHVLTWTVLTRPALTGTVLSWAGPHRVVLTWADALLGRSSPG